MSLTLVWSDRSADHAPPPGHPERVERASVMRAVCDRWREGGGAMCSPDRATREQLLRVHAAGYLDRLASASGHPAVLDADTYMSPDSYDAALLAAGAVVGATHHVLGGDAPSDARRAFALVRPPGHHALRDRAMGFCLLNNLAVAVADALACGVDRIAVVDYDVHHGNGTQWSFYADPRVLVVSLHQYPFYPHTGSAGECGVGEGEGFTVNVPMSAGGTDADYDLVLAEIVEPIVTAFAPRVLMVDAGFDAHERDPLAHMRVTTSGFGRVARRLRRLADTSAGGRLVMTVEGGYHLQALHESLDATVRALADPVSEGEVASAGPPTEVGTAAVALARAAQRRYWPGL